jgi:mRNA-degrading endonuclease RelE of RelBE toxin-antitoxin system
MGYRIEITEDAKVDLAFFKANERKRILAAIREQLSYEPLKETRNRKKLRENPISPWELRSGKYRVFYEVEEDIVTVGVISVGWKKHNILYIRGKEVKI